MKRTKRIALTALLCTAPAVLTTSLRGQDGTGSGDRNIRHVLFISIDGMHALDLATCVKMATCPAIAQIAAQGLNYTNASTSKPSDSIPAMSAILTGGSPAVTGMYYDDAYNRSWFAPTNLTCSGTPGAVIDLKFAINLNADGTGGVDPANMPSHLLNGFCTPFLPHNMMLLNTVFEIVISFLEPTASSEKRPSYEFL